MEVGLEILYIAAAVLLVTALAKRIRFSAPLLLLVVGALASFVPFIHEPQLTSEVVLLGFLPPLLYTAAIRTSVIDFRTNRLPIGFLSVGLVVFTAFGVGVVTWLLLGVPFAVAFALGAVVAPPDAVAATAIARRIGLPRRIVSLLEGESLVNDATAITCLRVAILAIPTAGRLTGDDVTVGTVTLGFLIAALGGLAVGLAVAAVTVAIRKRVQDPVFDTAISFMVPFAAYLPAEELGYGPFHGSGVIAVVTAGLVLGHKSPAIQSGRSRLSERTNWSTIQFLLENTVFLLIGLQTRRIVNAMIESDLSGPRIAGFCVAVLGTVIVLRLVWVAGYRVTVLRLDRSYKDNPPPWSYSFIVGWAGLRGVVTLAAALLIPADVPQRDVLVFAAMVVTAGTLLLQGLTLPAMVRRLRVQGPDPRADALQAATVLQSASNAALAQLDAIPEAWNGQEEMVARVRDRVKDRPDAMWELLGSDDHAETPTQQYRRLRLMTLQAEREEVLKIRSSGRVEHEVIEEVLDALDIEESLVSSAAERSQRWSPEEAVATPEDPNGACEHLADAPEPPEVADLVCQDCVREGTRTVHLRQCLDCGQVGCCDSSVGRHAERHFRTEGHPVMRSREPGESWRWCYEDERLG